MPLEKITQMRQAHRVVCEFPFEIKKLDRGYSDRILRIDLDKNEIKILPVTQQMKDLWTGGKGFDLWLMFQEINKDTKWDSPNNPICFSPGPLGGTTSFPGSGKTLVTSLSPLTQSIMDCNVGGFFGPYFKFAGFDALVLIGKAKEETIILIDAVKKMITIEHAPQESVDSHVLAEEMADMYADDEMDKRNIAVVSAGRGAEHARMGLLNFSFWDWRRNVPRLKQAGRGGIGTVFRDKKLKALVLKNRDITPAWRVEENKVAARIKPGKIAIQPPHDVPALDAIIEKWGNDPEFVIEMMQDIQEKFHHISKTAIDRLLNKTAVPSAYLYHIATFDSFFSLEEKNPTESENDKTPKTFTSAVKEPIVFRNQGAIDPEKIDDYIAQGGYKSLTAAIEKKDPAGIIQKLQKSKLRDRNSGLPVGKNWQTAYETGKENSVDTYLICNAGEKDSSAAINKSIIEIDPHSVIEGMLIGAYATGAKEGFLVLRKEHTLAAQRLQTAITAAEKNGYLGNNIQGSDFCFQLHVHLGAGASVDGETTSLIATISGRAGDARAKYIPIGEEGFRGKPTVLNSAETWANIPVILEKGANWFAAIGDNGSSGTKVISLTGKVGNACLVEVEMGTTLRQIIEQNGGGVQKGSNLKAVLMGGLSGGIIPESLLDTGIDFNSLNNASAMMGSGGLMVLDDKTCVVDLARDLTESLVLESCGKCTPCREGLYALQNTLTRICDGRGKEGDMEFLEEVSKTIAETGLCDFGSTAANPVLSSLHHFKDEYQGHIKQKTCHSGVCKFNAQEEK